MGRLEGKRAIVTGAASGIGRASVRLFAQEGARVLAVDRAEEGLRQTIDGLAGVEMTLADAGSEPDVRRFVALAEERFGGLDVVYANAGILGDLVPFLETEVATWVEVLRVNLIGAFLAIRHAAPIMARQGKGAIVCTASVAGRKANAGPAPYSASKAGVISLVQTAAAALTGTGVRVNAVCPGLIETGMTQMIFEGARARGTADRIGQLNPLQRHGEPEEIAQAAAFLASDAASYVNGQALPVCGGLSAMLPFAKTPMK
jgi:NAD(P)-dependent dehydrogenase (short-subunit alcohol dehydrogenase family)